jgi:uncharacterized delta-60 repeat protein
MRKSRRTLSSIVVVAMYSLGLISFQLMFVTRAHAAPGDLDPTFGIGGKVTRDFFGNRDEARAVVIQPNRRIVVAGVARSGTDQGPDAALEDFAVERYNAVVIQPNGKIVAAGGTCTGANFDICDFALARYNADGTRDATFGVGGKVTTAFPGLAAIAFGLAVRPSGAILATGFAFDGAGFDFALARYNRDGTLDTSFGNGGLVTTDFGAGDDFCLGVVIQHTGKIVAFGTAFNGANFDFALARYTRDGTLDPTFGAGGRVLTDFDWTDEEIRDLALQPNGQMVALGETIGGCGVAFALARYNRDGTLDEGFGATGLVVTDFGSADAQGEAVVIQPNGKILAGGRSVLGVNTDFQLARYNRDRTLDTSFGEGGMVTTDFFGGRDGALAIALHSRGEIVLAGFAFTGVSRDFALARYVLR